MFHRHFTQCAASRNIVASVLYTSHNDMPLPEILACRYLQQTFTDACRDASGLRNIFLEPFSMLLLSFEPPSLDPFVSLGPPYWQNTPSHISSFNWNKSLRIPTSSCPFLAPKWEWMFVVEIVQLQRVLILGSPSLPALRVTGRWVCGARSSAPCAPSPVYSPSRYQCLSSCPTSTISTTARRTRRRCSHRISTTWPAVRTSPAH